MPYANPSRAREAARERYARIKDDPDFRERRRKYNYAYYRRDIEKSRADKRERGRRNKYGLSREEMDALIAAHPACRICGSRSRLCVDHDHVTDCVRGMLCTGCNAALGFVERSGWLDAALAYLAAAA
jgi:hypothetical protein